MIENLMLKNFKCFRNLNVEMSNLNVLAGINNMGKSSVIHALLLVSHYCIKPVLSSTDDGTVELNNDIVSIGTNRELFYSGSSDDELVIQRKHKGVTDTYTFPYESNSNSAMYKRNINKDELSKLSNQDQLEVHFYQNINSRNFSFVSADRMTPKPFYFNSTSKSSINDIGVRGENTIHFLATEGESFDVQNESLFHPECSSKKIATQTAAWLSLIAPNIKLKLDVFNNMGISQVGYYTTANKDIHSPNNVGFGLSYTLPIIVALLKAPKDGIVILENPEAHLHPRGQRLLGEMIALTSAGGVQVIVETHSDHILNGIRLAVKNKKIDKSLVKLNYFTVDDDGDHIKQSPQILDDGSLTDWPEGFFDEWDKAVLDLF